MQPEDTHSGKHFRKKLRQLSIEVDGEDKPEKRASSAQHIRSGTFAFPNIDAARRKEIDDTILKLNNLELEKSALLEELERLKEGAVSALVEKEEVIEQLKEKVERAEQCKEAMGEEKQKQYSGLLSQLEIAVAEVEQYKKKVEELREEHIVEVLKRDNLICELGEELEQAKLTLQDLTQSEKTLSEKYNQAQSEKEELEDELVRSRVNLSILRESINHSLPGASDGGLEERSQGSYVKRKESAGDPFRLNTDESNELNDTRQRTWADIENQQIERLKQENNEQKERHQQQIQELRQYYEQKLEAARRRVEVEERVHIPFPKTQSSISVNRRVHQQLAHQGTQKRPVADLKKELIAAERIQARELNSLSNSDEEENDQLDKQETNSQFSSKYFQYSGVAEPQKQKRTQVNETIEETSPNEEKDPLTLAEWFRSLALPKVLLGSVLFGGLLTVLIRMRR